MRTSQVIRILLVVTAFCAFAASAMATDIRIIFDPSTPATLGNLYEINQPGVQYGVSWVSCSDYSSFNPAPSYDVCLGFFNNTGQPITALDLSFTVNSYLAGLNQTLDCATSGNNLVDNTCSPSGTLTAGESVNVDFFGGAAIPNSTAFFIGENGADYYLLPTVTITEPVPEPSMLSQLIPAALGVLAFGWWSERRRKVAA